MAGRGSYSHHGHGHDPFPSDPPEWFNGGRPIVDVGTPSQSRARSQATGRGTPMSQTVGGARSSGDQLFRRLGETDSQQARRERREDREDRMLESFEDTAANPAWHNTYDYVQDQFEYSTNYPSASEQRTPPSTHLYSSGSGSGSGSGSAGIGPQAESSRAAYIIPGQPTYQMDIEDPQMITYPLPVAQRSHKSSTGRRGASSSSRHGSSVHDRPVQALQTFHTYPEQEYPQEQYHQEQYPQGQYPQGQYPQGQYPEAQYLEQQYLQEQYPEEQNPEQQQQPEQPDLEQQFVASRRRRHSTHSSGDGTDSGCCVIL